METYANVDADKIAYISFHEYFDRSELDIL